MATRERADTGFSSRPTGCQPGAARLQKYLMAKFMLGNSGCWNPLSTMSSGGPSWHVYGKAIDLTANWNDPAARARGDAVFAWILTHRDELNLQQMIWGNSIWDVSTGAVRTYAHDDHKNHVHVAIGYQASQDWQPIDAPAPVTPAPIPKKGRKMQFIITEGSSSWFLTDGFTVRGLATGEPQVLVDCKLVDPIRDDKGAITPKFYPPDMYKRLKYVG